MSSTLPPAEDAAGAFTPQLVSMMRRETYGAGEFARDVSAGLTVAIIALPLSMAIAIASGAPPERGLFTAIVGGFLISALGGSRYQVGGPAGAFIVLVADIVARHGLDGLMLATFMAGFIMIAAGLLRLGALIKRVPHAVIAGFTAGIAVVIFASQIRDFLGLALPGKEPGPIFPKLQALAAALPGLQSAAVATGCLALIAILVIRRARPAWPALLIGIAAATLASMLLGLQVETIGSRFGGIPSLLPAPALPDLSAARMLALLPDALAIAALGGIESLLSAVVADKLSNRSHRPDCELVAQGIANSATALFGGICATGTIARTAANIRAGAHGPVSGMLHAAFLLAFMLLAAPLAGKIPLSALAAALIVTAWNMAESKEFATILTGRRDQALVLLATFGLTLAYNLIAGIAAGIVLAILIAAARRIPTR